MQFVNSSLTSIVIYTYVNHLRNISWNHTGRIQHGSDVDQDQGQDQVEIAVWADREGFSGLIADSRWPVVDFKYVGDAKTDGVTFENTTTVVITQHPDNRFVDMRAVSRPYSTQFEDAGPKAAESNAVAMTFAAAAIAGLATGFSAAGAPFALAAGMVAGFGYLILTLSDHAEPEEDFLTAPQLEFIMGEQFDKEAAETAATAFTTSSSDFAREVKEVAGLLSGASGHANGGDLTQEQLQTFKDFLTRDLYENRGVGTLNFSINHLNDHPEIAMWILPAYIIGIATYLMMLRLDIILKKTTSVGGVLDYTVTIADVEYYAAETSRLKGGLTNAVEAFQQILKQRINDAHLDGTIMEQQFSNLIAKSMFGIPDQAKIPFVIEKMTEVENSLRADINEGKPAHFLPPPPLPAG